MEFDDIFASAYNPANILLTASRERICRSYIWGMSDIIQKVPPVAKNILRIINTIPIWRQNILGYFSLDSLCRTSLSANRSFLGTDMNPRTSIQTYYMTSSVSGQDEPNLAL